MCEMFCHFFQKKREEKRIEEEQAAKAQNWKFPVCYDDDDDEERSNSLQDNIIFGLPPCSVITPNEPVDSLSMGDEHLNTIPATKLDEFINSSVENLVPNPKNESFRFDIPSFSRPPAKPPDGNTRILNIKMMDDISDQKLSSIPENLKALAKGFYPPSLHFLSFILGINLLHLAGSQPILKSSYKAGDGVIISIPPLVGGVADVVV
nr:hypothetical protein [Tanacetum cinerariifolium]